MFSLNFFPKKILLACLLPFLIFGLALLSGFILKSISSPPLNLNFVWSVHDSKKLSIPMTDFYLYKNSTHSSELLSSEDYQKINFLDPKIFPQGFSLSFKYPNQYTPPPFPLNIFNMGYYNNEKTNFQSESEIVSLQKNNFIIPIGSIPINFGEELPELQLVGWVQS